MNKNDLNSSVFENDKCQRQIELMRLVGLELVTLKIFEYFAVQKYRFSYF
jgi:hypothetical protein